LGDSRVQVAFRQDSRCSSIAQALQINLVGLDAGAPEERREDHRGRTSRRGNPDALPLEVSETSDGVLVRCGHEKGRWERLGEEHDAPRRRSLPLFLEDLDERSRGQAHLAPSEALGGARLTLRPAQRHLDAGRDEASACLGHVQREEP
jgi:hypothetical protein